MRLLGKDEVPISAIPYHKTDAILRKVISNILIHRDYGNAYPAKLIISII
ncbi:hypothetical protein [Clostridium estertheticum]|nr:hypothetical protein [Clostridium estertheticum]MBX4265115.1 hypothetical protein [Clostridium estertheticum]WLC88578.1 hypothetical protein KTC95_21705 [Clostridium estertheticum]